MLSTISRLEGDALIDQADLEVARQSQMAGTYRHTIGYELEVLHSAALETPQLSGLDLATEEPSLEAHQALGRYAYNVGCDGIYELQSPPSRHPLPLTIATRGIVKAGWLPERPKGMVTAHVSIGSSKPLPEAQHRLINILRCVELAGGTTPGRLYAPIKYAKAMGKEVADFSWNKRGTAGIDTDWCEATNWRGGSQRIEFRTIRYQSPEQFGETMGALYFLTRGLLSGPNQPAYSIYHKFEEWFRDYQQRHDMVHTEEDCAHDFRETTRLDEYLKPYISYLADADNLLLRGRVSRAVTDLAEEFNMAHPSERPTTAN